MGKLKDIRKFGEKRYNYHSAKKTKTEAEKTVKAARRTGYLARFVKVKNGYNVYTRIG